MILPGIERDSELALNATFVCWLILRGRYPPVGMERYMPILGANELAQSSAGTSLRLTRGESREPPSARRDDSGASPGTRSDA